MPFETFIFPRFGFFVKLSKTFIYPLPAPATPSSRPKTFVFADLDSLSVCQKKKKNTYPPFPRHSPLKKKKKKKKKKSRFGFFVKKNSLTLHSQTLPSQPTPNISFLFCQIWILCQFKKTKTKKKKQHLFSGV